MLHAGDGVEQNDPPFLLTEGRQRMPQQGALDGIQPPLFGGNGVPFLVAERGVALLPPQLCPAEVPAYGQDPAQGRAGGAVLLRVVPHLHVDVLGEVLRVLRVPEVRECQASTALLCLGLAALVCLLSALTAVPWTRWLLQEYESEGIWRAIWLLPAGYTGIYLLSMPRFPQETELLLLDRVQEISVLTCLLPLGVYLLFLYLFYVIGRESARNLRLTEENHVLAVESHRYEQLRNYLEKTRTLRHDFRQHLRVISGLSEAGELEELRAYLRQCSGELAEERVTLCASPAVDAIAAYYDAAARRADISISWQLDLPQKLPLPEADLCMMLGNLLENALRASHALPPEQRRVQVICRMLSPGMLGLIVENRYDGVLRRRGGKLLSTSHPGSGVGLLSVQTAVDRYQGRLSLETEDHTFRVNILLNV